MSDWIEREHASLAVYYSRIRSTFRRSWGVASTKGKQHAITTSWAENGIGIYFVFNEDYGIELIKPAYIYPNREPDSPCVIGFLTVSLSRS